jgi:hypothetical protein
MKILSAPLSRLRLAWRFNWRNITSSAKTVGGASYALLAVLFALLIFAVVIAVAGWHSAAGADVPVIGYVAMAGGVLLQRLPLVFRPRLFLPSLVHEGLCEVVSPSRFVSDAGVKGRW